MDQQLRLNHQLSNALYSKSAYNIHPEEGSDIDRSERDATHPLLRTDQHLINCMQCLDCNGQIQNNSFSDICAHYLLYRHPQSIAKCLYCSGNVHYYLKPGKVSPEVFHYCSPRKQSKETNTLSTKS